MGILLLQEAAELKRRLYFEIPLMRQRMLKAMEEAAGGGAKRRNSSKHGAPGNSSTHTVRTSQTSLGGTAHSCNEASTAVQIQKITCCTILCCIFNSNFQCNFLPPAPENFRKCNAQLQRDTLAE